MRRGGGFSEACRIPAPPNHRFYSVAGRGIKEPGRQGPVGEDLREGFAITLPLRRPSGAQARLRPAPGPSRAARKETVIHLALLDLPPVVVALVITIVIISLGCHEAAHGWMALKRGDPTARDLGRITLNPIVHIDPFMTIALPLLTFYIMGFPFGGAKPVPVAYHNLRKPLRDMALVAIAGPLSNMFLASLFFLLRHVLVYKLHVWEEAALGDMVLFYAIYLNLLLAAFNLVPIPPLDGSRVMAWLLPSGLREPYVQLERFGLFLVVAVVFIVPGFWELLEQTMDLLYGMIRTVLTFGGAW